MAKCSKQLVNLIFRALFLFVKIMIFISSKYSNFDLQLNNLAVSDIKNDVLSESNGQSASVGSPLCH
jgi:hypothetical protein